MRARSSKLEVRSLIVVAALTLTAGAMRAQETQGEGFLFGPPVVSFSLRGGYGLAFAGSDLFQFVTKELTIGRRDFDSFTWGGDVGLRLSRRFELQLSGDFAGMSKDSEFRDWLDNNDKPIEQTTSFNRSSISVGLKYYLVDNGRTLGRLAWIPAKYAPFVGAGAGTMWYDFKQNGDFIDFNNNNKVFHDVFESSGAALMMHVMGGFDWSMDERWGVTTQARYVWSNAELGRDYSGFNRIDLSGLSTTVGFNIRF